MRNILLFITATHATESIGIVFTTDPQGNYNNQNFQQSVKDAVDSKFNRIYLSGYQNKNGADLGLSWEQLASDTKSSTATYVKNKNGKILLRTLDDIISLFLQPNYDVNAYAIDLVEYANSNFYHGVDLDLSYNNLERNPHQNPLAVNDDLLSKLNDLSQTIMSSGLALSHRVKPEFFGSWAVPSTNFNTPTSDPSAYPTPYGMLIQNLAKSNNFDAVNLDFQYTNPDFRTDNVTLYQNSSSLDFYNGIDISLDGFLDYTETAVDEILISTPVEKNVFNVGKRAIDGVDSEDLACWKQNSQLAKEKQKGFFTWPYYTTASTEQGYKSSAEWASDIINECGDGPDASNSSGILFLSFLSAFLIFL